MLGNHEVQMPKCNNPWPPVRSSANRKICSYMRQHEKPRHAGKHGQLEKISSNSGSNCSGTLQQVRLKTKGIRIQLEQLEGLFEDLFENAGTPMDWEHTCPVVLVRESGSFNGM